MPGRLVKPVPPRVPRSRRRWVAAVGLGLAAAVAAWATAPEDAGRLRARAQAAAAAGDWPSSASAWGRLNRSGAADAGSWREEARAWLASGRAARAERALARAAEADPADPGPWLLRLELLRMEDRVVEARRLGWRAFEAVGPADRRRVLEAMTLALLGEAPDDLAREALGRWIEADPDDADARVALLRRIAPKPRLGDPDVRARLATLEALLGRDPGHVDAREALVLTLADAGDPGRGRALLDAWPAGSRDARYHRLRGRWDLEYDRRPDRAIAAFRLALEELPHDWRTRARLARALRARGREADARREAVAVARLREALDPEPLARRLSADLDRLDDPRSRLDLADLCHRVGLSRLADAWRRDADEPHHPWRSPEPLNGLGPPRK